MATALFALLILALPLLMLLSHLYIMRAQDNLQRYLVVLKLDAQFDEVLSYHTKRYKLTGVQPWRSSIKGYTAVIPLRKLRALSEDPNVEWIQAREADELSSRWLPD